MKNLLILLAIAAGPIFAQDFVREASVPTSCVNGVSPVIVVSIGTPGIDTTFLCNTQGRYNTSYTAKPGGFIFGAISGTVGAGTAGQFGKYLTTGTTISGYTLVNGDIVAALGYTPASTTTASKTDNDCAKWLSGQVVDAGAPCGSSGGSGTVGNGTAGQFGYYSASGTSILGHTIILADLPTSGSSQRVATTTSTSTNGNCAKFDASGNVIDNGAPCGSGGSGITQLIGDGTAGPGSGSQTLTFANTGVTAGTYTSPASIAVDAKGRLTSVTGGTAQGGQPILQSPVLTAEGDSITVGYLANGMAGQTCNSCAYTSQASVDNKSTTYNLQATTGYTSCDINATQTFIKDIPTTPFSMDFASIQTLMIGTNDADKHGAGAYETGVYEPCHQAMISWRALANKYIVTDTSQGGICTNTGTWTFQAGGGGGSEWAVNNDNTSQVGATKTCPIVTYGKPIYFWSFVQDSHTGANFTYAVDGGSAVTVNGFTTPAIAATTTFAWVLNRITVSAGAHTIVFTNVSGSNSILSIATPPAQHYYNEPKVFVGGIPKAQFNNQSSLFSAYNSDALSDVNTLAGDGLGAYFVNVRGFLCTQLATVGGVANSCINDQGVADMNTTTVDPPTSGGNSLHPNPQGQIDLKRAFEEAMQFTPNGSSTGSGTVTSVAAPSGSWPAWLVPTVTNSTTTPSLAVAATAQGNGAKVQLSTGTTTTNDCAKFDANGNVIDAGAACGTGSGNFTPSPTIIANALVASNSGATGYGFYTVAPTTGGLAVTNGQVDLVTSIVCINAGTCSPTGQRNYSSVAAGSTPLRSVSSLPGTCTPPEMAYLTTATAGQNIYSCTATNTWTQQGGSGGGSTAFSGLTSGTNTAAAMVIGSGASLAATGSGTVAATSVPDSGLPADQCVLTKYTVAFSALTSQATTTPTSPLFTMAGTSTRICLVEIAGTTSFAGTSVTAANVHVQSGSGTPILYSPNQDIFGSVGPGTNNYWSDYGNAADRTNTSVVAAFTLTGANATALTAGSVSITIGIRTMP